VVASAFNILDLIGRRGAFNADDLSSAPHESLVHFQETLGDLRDEVGATRAIPASLVPRALGVACLVLISQEDHDRTFAFYADVARAARGEEAHPVSAMLVGALREHLAAERRSREVTVGYLFEAWHHWSRDARPERFGFQGRRAGRGYADWPEIVGVDRIDFPHPPKPPKDLQGADLARLAAHYGEMVASSGVTVEFVPAVDPATGEEWLRRNLRNRNLRPAFVARYRRAMRQGWEVNGKTVKFSADGLMRDGQHRTMAGIEEGVAWPTFVVRGLGPDVFIALDRQGRLSLREILRKDGFHNAQTLASALSALRLFPEADLGGIPLGDLSFEEQRRLIVERHPGLPVSAERYGQKGSFVGVMSPGVVVALHYLAAKEDRRAADAFFDQLRLDLGKGDPRHNAQILRGILTRLALSRARHPSPAKQAELIRMAYERTLSGGRLTKQEVQEALKG